MCIQILGNVYDATSQAIFQIIARTDDPLTLQKKEAMKRNKFSKKIYMRVLSLQKEM